MEVSGVISTIIGELAMSIPACAGSGILSTEGGNGSASESPLTPRLYIYEGLEIAERLSGLSTPEETSRSVEGLMPATLVPLRDGIDATRGDEASDRDRHALAQKPRGYLQQ
jgi:hypothetical protein